MPQWNGANSILHESIGKITHPFMPSGSVCSMLIFWMSRGSLAQFKDPNQGTVPNESNSKKDRNTLFFILAATAGITGRMA